jgi:hypothetical protein
MCAKTSDIYHLLIDHEPTLYFQLGPGLIYHHWTSGQIIVASRPKMLPISVTQP